MPMHAQPPAIAIRLSFPAAIHRTPVNGRVYVIVTKDPHDPERQLLEPSTSPPFFGKDVENMKPGSPVTIDARAPGFPLRSLSDVPAGTYYVEGLLVVYQRYHRADGHTIWAPAQWSVAAASHEVGTYRSAIEHVALDPHRGISLDLSLNQPIVSRYFEAVNHPAESGPNAKWIRHVRIRSPILTRWWGAPFYLGATILLPRGYATHPNAHYPVVYNQDHFDSSIPWGFTADESTETPQAIAEGKRGGYGTGYEFYEAWNSPHFPRFIMVTWQHPCPFFDDSYAVNSANCGPFGDAIMHELIPYIESHFRIIRKPYARIVEGGSTGGWESLALQIQYPEFFGGAWIFDPDPIDLRSFQLVDLYKDDNAFAVPSPDGWQQYSRPWERADDGQPVITNRSVSEYEEVLGSHGRSEYQLDAWWAVFDPAGADGYPVPMWNMRTGAIDRSAVNYARDHGYDLTYYMRQHWPTLGPQLQGKLHFTVGDMDDYYLNLAVYRAQAFLASTRDPHSDATFAYGRPMKGHGWHPMTWAQLLEAMARHVRTGAHGDDVAQWNY
jgi:hypothetical protein